MFKQTRKHTERRDTNSQNEALTLQLTAFCLEWGELSEISFNG